MLLDFDHKRMVPAVFYSYPTCVVDRITQFEESFDGSDDHNKGDEDVKEFFEDCLKYAEERLGRHLRDNKIAMKIVLPDTGQHFFVGYKDHIYTIGLTLHPHMTGSREFII